MVDKELLKKLRIETNASYSDCKSALEETKTYEEAIKWLRSRGAAKAVKKIAAEATDGVIALKIHEHKAVMMEVNSQTDFVARNEKFTEFVHDLLEVVYASNVKTLDGVNQLRFDDKSSVGEKILEMIAVTGEKISLRRIAVVNTNEVIGGYLHANKRIGVIVVANCGDQNTLKQVAMHIAALSPTFIDESQVDEKWRNEEIKIIKNQLEMENKPTEFIEKIVEGRYHKLLQENVLIHQDFIMDSKVKVGDFLRKNGIRLSSIIRFEVGEGMHKCATNSEDDYIILFHKKN